MISSSEVNLSSLNHDSSHAVGEQTPVQHQSKTECNKSSLRRTDRLTKGEEILRNMVLHISNEDAYMHYFKQLMEFDYLAKNSKTDNLQTFEIMPFNKVHRTKICKIKKSNKINNVKIDRVSRKDTLIKNTRSSKNKTSEEIILKVNFTVELFKRIQLRQAVLHDFEIYCYDEELHDNFVNRLVDFEESLINEL